MVVCLERGADLHMAQLMPLPLTVSCSSKIQIGLIFLVPAYPVCPEKEAIKWLLLLLYNTLHYINIVCHPPCFDGVLQFNNAVHKTDPPVVAFLERDAECLVGIGNDSAVFAGEVHSNATFHVQQASTLRTHTHTHPFSGPLSGTTGVSWYQKCKTSLDFTEARDSEWQWHQLGHMQVCTSPQIDNHASTPPLSFIQTGCPSCHSTNSVKALKAFIHKQNDVRKIENSTAS